LGQAKKKIKNDGWVDVEMYWIGRREENENKRKITLRDDDLDQTNNKRVYRYRTLFGSIGWN